MPEEKDRGRARYGIVPAALSYGSWLMIPLIAITLVKGISWLIPLLK